MGLTYVECETIPTTPKPAVPITQFDMPSLMSAGVIRHVFASTGAKARPVWLDVNGRQGRRAVCVLYGDGMRYDVLDLDVTMEEHEENEDEEVHGA